jgi:transposase-like protein
MAVKKSKRHSWSVSEKLEVVQARQRGLTLAEIWALYRAGNRAISQWVKAYEDQGIAGLEQTGNRPVRGMSARVAAAEQVLEQATQVSEADPPRWLEPARRKACCTGMGSWGWRGKR